MFFWLGPNSFTVWHGLSCFHNAVAHGGCRGVRRVQVDRPHCRHHYFLALECLHGLHGIIVGSRTANTLDEVILKSCCGFSKPPLLSCIATQLVINSGEVVTLRLDLDGRLWVCLTQPFIILRTLGIICNSGEVFTRTVLHTIE